MDEETMLEQFEAWHIDAHGWFDLKAKACADRWEGFQAAHTGYVEEITLDLLPVDDGGRESFPYGREAVGFPGGAK